MVCLNVVVTTNRAHGNIAMKSFDHLGIEPSHTVIGVT